MMLALCFLEGVRRRSCSLFAGAILFLTFPAWAAFSVAPPDHCPSDYSPGRCFQLKGEIGKADASKVEATVADYLAQHKKGTLMVVLDSAGGDVDAAIRIGRALRKIRGYGFVRGDCLSACVFVLAGTTYRAIAGNVGIHRPYMLSRATSFEATQRDYTRLVQDVKTYLADMNLPPQLYETMVQVPTHRIKILTENELSTFGLDREDPVQEDYMDSLAATRLGIAKREYLRRKATADLTCGNNRSFAQAEETGDQILCRERVLSSGS